MSNLDFLPSGLIVSYIFIIGICIGSFLNVVILRSFSGEGIVFSRSHCPKCLKQLKWYMNIPLFSYIFLKGKCAFCKTKISIQYPLVEFITGCLFVFSYLAFGLTLKTIFVCVILSLFVIIAATDFLETSVFTIHTYILAFVGILYSLLNLSGVSPLQSIIGAVSGFLVFELLARIGYFFAKYRAFGEGDSYIALALGAVFGVKNFIIIVALSFLIQSLYSIPLLIKKAYLEGKKRLSVSYFGVILSVLFLFFVNYFDFFKNEFYYLIFVILIVSFLFFALKNIIFEIRTKSKNAPEDFDECALRYCLLPFGPALIFASCLCIFYIDKIKEILHRFLF